MGLQPEPWYTVPYDPPSAAWGEAGAEIRGVQKWKSSWVGEDGGKVVVRRGQG